MQTFVPYPDPTASALCLDNKRLGKQRVEVLQLLNALAGASRGWSNHPAARMWRGHTNALVYYGTCICGVWMERGFNDTCYEKILTHWDNEPGDVVYPTWWGRVDVHLSHQSNLVRKDPTYYRTYFPDVPDDLEYVWPVP